VIRKILIAAAEAIEQGLPFVMITVVTADGSSPGKPGHKMIVFPDGRELGTVGGGGVETQAKAEAPAMLARGEGGVRTYDLDPESPGGIGAACGGKVTLAFEVFAGTERILLCGAGHVALAFARLCVDLGYVHTVVDGRADLATSARFPGAAEIVLEPPPEFVRHADLARYSRVVIFTHDHHLDGETLRQLHGRGYAGTIGMIGSARKWKEIRGALAASGVPEDWLVRVRCPIGLEIGSRTPPEIAVSIAAQIVKERNTK
jgi:xanthine dehydrogenase accessory factor